MKSHCLKSKKKDTENINPNVLGTSNGNRVIVNGNIIKMCNLWW